MKITIDVPQVYVRVLSEWASVSRTLTAARLHLINYSGLLETDSAEEEKAIDIEDELVLITPALDCIHYAVRSELWEIQKKAKEEKARYG